MNNPNESYKTYKKTLDQNIEYIITISTNIDNRTQFNVIYISNINDYKPDLINKNECFIIINTKDYLETQKILGDAWMYLGKIQLNSNINIISTNEENYNIAKEIEKIMNNVVIIDKRKKEDLNSTIRLNDIVNQTNIDDIKPDEINEPTTTKEENKNEEIEKPIITNEEVSNIKETPKPIKEELNITKKEKSKNIIIPLIIFIISAILLISSLILTLKS